MTPWPPPSLRDTSPKYDDEYLGCEEINCLVGFGGGWVGVAFEGRLV
jgi:hypothetical protein